VVVFGQSRLENSFSGALKYRVVSETAAFEYPKKYFQASSKRVPYFSPFQFRERQG
jgi:hypothetical protein